MGLIRALLCRGFHGHRSVSAALRTLTLMLVAVVTAGLIVALPWGNGVGLAEGEIPEQEWGTAAGRSHLASATSTAATVEVGKHTSKPADGASPRGRSQGRGDTGRCEGSHRSEVTGCSYYLGLSPVVGGTERRAERRRRGAAGCGRHGAECDSAGLHGGLEPYVGSGIKVASDGQGEYTYTPGGLPLGVVRVVCWRGRGRSVRSGSGRPRRERSRRRVSSTSTPTRQVAT